jgi:thioesterase domain-containing protein
VRDVFRHPTPAALARPRAGGRSRFAFDPVLPLRRGTGEPLFCVAPASGIAWIYARLAEPLECPIYGLQAPGLHPGEAPAADIAQLVELHLPRIREIQPEGPYRLMGHSFGGLVAHALAVALRAEGERVSLLGLLDCYPAQPDADPDREPELGPLDLSAFELSDEELDAVHRVRAASARLAARFVPGTFDGDALFFSAADDPRTAPGAWRAWAPHVRGRIENHDIAADHHQMMRAAAPLSAIARVLKEKTRKGTD